MALAAAEQAERSFAKAFLNTISTQRITYADDYQQPSEHSLRRVPVFPVAVPPPPERKAHLEASSSSSASLSLVFKSLKPPATYTLSVQPTDTIATIKTQLATLPSAPPSDAQRLLLKGKALADGKLLREYTIKDGDTLNLVVKPGFNWDPSAPSATTSEVDMASGQSQEVKGFGSGSLDPNARPAASKGRHGRIPSVVLSPSPTPGSPSGQEKDILLTLDTGAVPDSLPSPEVLSSYHETVANPEFWQKLHNFLKQEFTTDADVILAFEDFLCAAKGSLTPHEIAKIRDTVGVTGMAGH
ncbi:hypothetical protein CPB83DRAFT_860246 [Crepidotus variabilis]|uniref:Ubiquitin-like domain-containing protein n=1 Tax=Crepidotus variabilis TaxID=179855 RepID=A0A9P6E9Q3_9AGAR|nr:hypothetical protein CPB83DRAFT_860246 [Crepidotus variabilis]